MDFASQLYHHACTRPRHRAVIGVERSLDYLSLYVSSNTLAGELREQVPSGDRVGIYCTDPIDLAIAFHACVIAGISAMILDPAWPEARLEQLLELFGSPKVLCDARGESQLARLGQNPIRVSVIEQTPQLTQQKTTSTDPGGELLVIFTSGSTGFPKAVVRNRNSWEQSIEQGAALLGATENATTLLPGPLAHGLGLYAMVESIATGGTLVSPGRWNIDEVSQLLQSTPCDRVVAVPTLLRLMLEHIEPNLLTSFRQVVSGGELLTDALAQRILAVDPEISCTEYYGSSEHSLIAYRHHHRSIPSNCPTEFVGTFFPGVKAHLHDRQENGVGRLMIDSDFNATGYDPRGDGELERCQNSTGIGDLAKILPHHQVQVYGRGGTMLIVNGNNIYPAEITTALEKCGLVQPVIRTQEETSGKTQIIAYCLLDLSAVLPAGRSLFQQLKELLPAYKIPHQLVFLPHWPLTTSGKKDVLNLPLPTTTNLRKLCLR